MCHCCLPWSWSILVSLCHHLWLFQWCIWRLLVLTIVVMWILEVLRCPIVSIVCSGRDFLRWVLFALRVWIPFAFCYSQVVEVKVTCVLLSFSLLPYVVDNLALWSCLDLEIFLFSILFCVLLEWTWLSHLLEKILKMECPCLQTCDHVWFLFVSLLVIFSRFRESNLDWTLGSFQVLVTLTHP